MKRLLSLFVFSTLILLVCSSQKQEHNQRYADDVIKVFFEQAKTYESQIRPLISQRPLDANKEKVIEIWRKSFSDFVDGLNHISDEGVDSELVNLKHQLISTYSLLNSNLTVQLFNGNNSNITNLFERIDSLQITFEQRVDKLGLSLYAKGIK